jgi:hypothetical protein
MVVILTPRNPRSGLNQSVGIVSQYLRLTVIEMPIGS